MPGMGKKKKKKGWQEGEGGACGGRRNVTSVCIEYAVGICDLTGGGCIPFKVGKKRHNKLPRLVLLHEPIRMGWVEMLSVRS